MIDLTPLIARLGFAFPSTGVSIGNLTINSLDPNTNAFDITELAESFGTDSNGYADNTLASDNNGNQTYDGLQSYTYDAWNRPIKTSHAYRDSGGTLHSGQVLSQASYDALGRRITKTVTGTGVWDGTLNYYLDGDSVVEEQNGSAMTVKQFIWGKDYIDDLIQVSLNSNPSGQSTCDTPYWAMCDANWNVLGLVNSSGTLIERYDYTPYGQRSVYMRSGSGFEGVSGGTNDPGCYLPLAASQRFVTSGSVSQFYGLCEAGFQGLMHDEETGNIYVRHREESPTLGRWMEEDPLGYKDGLNLYVDEQDDPIRYLDPQGTDSGGGAVQRGADGRHSTIAVHAGLAIPVLAEQGLAAVARADVAVLALVVPVALLYPATVPLSRVVLWRLPCLLHHPLFLHALFHPGLCP